MKIICCFIIFSIFISVFTLHAQQQLPGFGKIDMAELQMKVCPFEKDASAMNLIDEETAEMMVDNYSDDIRIKYVRRVRIKIFNERGYKNASIIIPYFGNNSITKITDINATIYNAGTEGKIDMHQLTADEIYKDKGGGKKGANSIRFTFPGLKPGSIVEYRYTKIRKGSAHLEPWFFQNKIPTQVSSCTIIAPPNSDIKAHFVTSQQVVEDSLAEKENTDKMMLRRYSMQNIPSFRVEPLMSSVKDNLQRAEFSVTPYRRFSFNFSFDAAFMWEFLNEELLSSSFFGGQFKKSLSGTQNTLDSIRLLPGNADKINAVYEYVKKNVRWNKEQTFYADDINAVWKNKSGTSAEINMIIINLLQKAGIKCYPILISTRENGYIDMTFPNIGQFNGVDVLVEDSTENYILDGTLEYQSYKIPPFNILNRQALIIDAKESKWVHITDDRPLINSFISTKGDIDSNGILRGETVVIFKDYAKAERLEDDKDDEEAREEKDKDFLLDDQPDLKIDSVEKTGDDDISKPLTRKLKFHYTLANTDDIYFINPFILTMFRKNPFTDSIRRTDIDFGCNQLYTNSIYITIPENFSVEEIPKSIIIRTADTAVVFKRQTFAIEGGVIIRTNFELNYPLFAKEEYPALKSFFEKIYALTNEQIVLKKLD